MRERTPMTPFPAPNRLHVWWARRPLVASRAAILAFLACRPRAGFGVPPSGGQTSESSTLRETSNAQPAGAGTPNDPIYWEDVEPKVAAAVRQRVEEFQ